MLERAVAETEADLPDTVREMGALYLDQMAWLTEVIEHLAAELKIASKMDADLRRLCTVPGIGPVTAGAIAAFAPDLSTFESGRNFAASCWKCAFVMTQGLVPRQRSTGGKARPGAVSKMGQTDSRRPLIVGAPLGKIAVQFVCRATHEREAGELSNGVIPVQPNESTAWP